MKSCKTKTREEDRIHVAHLLTGEKVRDMDVHPAAVEENIVLKSLNNKISYFQNIQNVILNNYRRQCTSNVSRNFTNAALSKMTQEVRVMA